MSVWQCAPSASVLCGSEGELISVTISVAPRDLEALLETLSQVDFPINPQIYHGEGHPPGSRTVVEFPAYAGQLGQVREVVARVHDAIVSSRSMWQCGAGLYPAGRF